MQPTKAHKMARPKAQLDTLIEYNGATCTLIGYKGSQKQVRDRDGNILALSSWKRRVKGAERKDNAKARDAKATAYEAAVTNQIQMVDALLNTLCAEAYLQPVESTEGLTEQQWDDIAENVGCTTRTLRQYLWTPAASVRPYDSAVKAQQADYMWRSNGKPDVWYSTDAFLLNRPAPEMVTRLFTLGFEYIEIPLFATAPYKGQWRRGNAGIDVAPPANSHFDFIYKTDSAAAKRRGYSLSGPNVRRGFISGNHVKVPEVKTDIQLQRESEEDMKREEAAQRMARKMKDRVKVPDSILAKLDDFEDDDYLSNEHGHIFGDESNDAAYDC